MRCCCCRYHVRNPTQGIFSTSAGENSSDSTVEYSITHQETSNSIECRFHMKMGCQILHGNPNSYIMPAITVMYPRNETSTAVRNTGR